MASEWAPLSEQEALALLDPDLRLCIDSDGPTGLTFIRHPLVVEIFVSEKSTIERQNQLLAWKRDAVKKAVLDGDLAKFLWLHERAFRLATLRDLWTTKTIDRRELRTILPGVWSDAEPDDTDRRWLTLWKAAANKDGIVLSEGAQAPNWSDLQKIYRGGGKPKEKLGIAWTTDYEIAKFFALRFRDIGVIFTARVPLGVHPYGYITDRGESEVIVDPKQLEIIETASVVGKNPKNAAVVHLVQEFNQ